MADTIHTPHFVSRAEAIKGLSNRFVFSTFYIYLYLGMALLSFTTVTISVMSDGCPSALFYILELVINTTMISEVLIRLLAFGAAFWKSYYNILDLVITVLSIVTVLVIVSSRCEAKGEEMFDTVILIARNLFQFARLALVLRKSGKNVFSAPAAIDLTAADSYVLDLDLEEDEALRPPYQHVNTSATSL